MNPLTISLPDYLYKKLMQQAKTFDTSVEGLVLFSLKRDEAKAAAVALLRRRAGKCLIAREPIFKAAEAPPVWVVPIFTNVEFPVGVGEIVIDADTGEVLSTKREVGDMIKKGHASFGFKLFPLEKQERLAELLALNGEKT